MKIIRKMGIESKQRPDGRVVTYYSPLDVPEGTKQIGFITVNTPKDCNEDEHIHPVSAEIIYHLTPGKVQVNGKVYDLESGDIIILEPGDKHKQIAIDNDIDTIILRIPFSIDKQLIR